MQDKIVKKQKQIAVVLLFFFLSSIALTTIVVAETVTVSGTMDYSQAYYMLDLINAQRTAAGLAPLVYDYALEDEAMQRASELSILNAHSRPDGSGVYYYENYSIGWGSADAAMNAFMGSDGHRSNILSPNFAAMGGAAVAIDGQWYWVQCFHSAPINTASHGLSGQGAIARTVAGAPSADQVSADENISIELGSYIVVDTAVNGQMTSANWTSSDNSVATVDASGKISGVGLGSCVVTADLGVTTRTISVTVTEVIAAGVEGGAPPPETAPPTEASEPPTEATAAPTEASEAPSEVTDATEPPTEPSEIQTENTESATQVSESSSTEVVGENGYSEESSEILATSQNTEAKTSPTSSETKASKPKESKESTTEARTRKTKQSQKESTTSSSKEETTTRESSAAVKAMQVMQEPVEEIPELLRLIIVALSTGGLITASTLLIRAIIRDLRR